MRSKNKYIIFTLIILVLSAGASHACGGTYLYNKARRAHQEGDYIKALAYYDSFIEGYPEHGNIPEALFYSADLMPDFEGYKVSLVYGGVTWKSTSGQPDDFPRTKLTKSERYLKVKEEFPNHPWARFVDYYLGITYYQADNPKSEECLLRYLYGEETYSKDEAAWHLLIGYRDQNRLEEAMQVVEYLENNIPSQIKDETQMEIGEVYAALGKYDLARESFEKAILMIEDSYHNQDIIRDQVSFEHRKNEVEKSLARLDLKEKGQEVITEGRITLLGKPLAGIKVLANERYRSSGALYPQVAFSYSARDGSFSGTLVPGTYWFQVILNYQQAKKVEGTYLIITNGESTIRAGIEQGPVEFTFVEPVQLNSPSPGSLYGGGSIEINWEPYPGACEYSIEIEASQFAEDNIIHRRLWSDYIKTDETDCLVEFLDPHFLVHGYDRKGVLPESYFNLLDLYDLVEVKVKALDQEGKVISASERLVFDENRGVTGEMIIAESLKSPVKYLLNERKYDEALEYLERAIKENPNDEELLWILARMYTFGTYKILGDKGVMETAHKDYKKAYGILQHIREISPGENVNKALETVHRWLVTSL